jgi:exopolysaccharide biosynthesis polyprenyl glycosylphosphotransferase
VYFFIITTFLLLADRALTRMYYRLARRSRPGWHKRVLIIGAGELGQQVAHVLLDHSRWGYNVLGFLDDDPKKQGLAYGPFKVLGGINEIEGFTQARQIEEVWVALPLRSYQRLREIVEVLDPLPVRINIVPDYFSLALVRAKPDVLGGIPVIGLREPVLTTSQAIIKRLFDILVGVFLMIFCMPILILVAIAIRAESAGSVIFRQKRAGENGRLFDMYKFRTMISDAETRQVEVIEKTADGAILHKTPTDPRVTRVGAFLRRYSLDELPQFFNVIKGDMSLVGPRPEMPWLIDRYEPWQRKRFAVPQGITGWWQINGRSDKPMHLNTEFDLYYVYNYSLWLDIRILLRTPVVVARGEGAF